MEELFDYVNYCDIPNILNNSDILLMPYANKVFVRSKSLNTANYCSPLKMFDYLAANHKSDYLRAYMLYHYGGAYHDVKWRIESSNMFLVLII